MKFFCWQQEFTINPAVHQAWRLKVTSEISMCRRSSG